MSNKALFEGLVFDEAGRPLNVTLVGGEACYVVDDAGFLRHVPTEQVDRRVLQLLGELIEGYEDTISEQAAKMLGQDDIFSRAIIENQLKNIDQQFDALLQTGVPEETRAFMGMAGFRITVNLHGEVIDIQQPGMLEADDDGE